MEGTRMLKLWKWCDTDCRSMA